MCSITRGVENVRPGNSILGMSWRDVCSGFRIRQQTVVQEKESCLRISCLLEFSICFFRKKIKANYLSSEEA